MENSIHYIITGNVWVSHKCHLTKWICLHGSLFSGCTNTCAVKEMGGVGEWLFPDRFLFLMSVGQFPTWQQNLQTSQAAGGQLLYLDYNHPASRHPHFAIKERLKGTRAGLTVCPTRAS